MYVVFENFYGKKRQEIGYLVTFLRYGGGSLIFDWGLEYNYIQILLYLKSITRV